jgi:hypothetical protein
MPAITHVFPGSTMVNGGKRDYHLAVQTSTGFLAIKNSASQTVVYPADGTTVIQVPRSRIIALWSCQSAGEIDAETGMVKPDGKILKLKCAGNQLRELSVETLCHLQELDCSNNLLTKLNLAETVGLNPVGLPHLKSVNCSNNKLQSLILGKTLTRLENLDCSKNQLPIIDLAGLVALQVLNARENQIGPSESTAEDKEHPLQ